MKKYNILVFPCGSEIGLEVFRSLRYSTHFNLIGASSIDDHGKFVYENYIENVPFIDSEDVIPFLRRIVKEYSIDAIYPTMDKVIEKLKLNELILDCKVISSCYETTQICLNKLKTYETFKKYLHVPIIYNEVNDIKEYPVFIKPEIGYGSRDVFRAENEYDAFHFLSMNKNKKYIICEYLPGKEYTVDCFTNRHGELKFVGPRARNRINNGISVNTTLVKDVSEFWDIAAIINKIIPFRGAWFFQVKEDKNKKLTLLEIAARLGGSSGLYRCLGVNFALLSVFDIFDIDIEIIKNNYDIELDRALTNNYKTNLFYKVVYVDFDDCLVINQKLNLELIKFLYQAVNNGKKIILLTKSKNDIKTLVKKYKISELFDEIVSINQNDNKYKFIRESDAIFIDDSFREREEIIKNLNIPVFSPDMVESLIY